MNVNDVGVNFDSNRKTVQQAYRETGTKANIAPAHRGAASPDYIVEISPTAYEKANHAHAKTAAGQADASFEVSEKDQEDIVHCLKSDWLEQAEGVIMQRYGLSGDGATLKVAMEDGDKDYLAAITYDYDASGKAVDQTLHVVVDTATPAELPDGGKAPMYDDRVITHEMVHVIMGRTMNFSALPTWFKEGTAEFIHGADERVARSIEKFGGGEQGMAAVQNAFGDGTDDSWEGDSLHYSAAYSAVRYLHEQIKAGGNRDGIKALLAELQHNQTETFDEALSHVSKYKSVRDFATDFVTNGNGAAMIRKMDQSGELAAAMAGNGDTGAIGGASVDGGPVLTAATVIPDINRTTDTPLKNFHVVWPTGSEDAEVTAAQILVDRADR